MNIEDAKKGFLNLMKQERLNDFILLDTEYKLSELLNSKGILPLLMLQSDEISASMKGVRLWDDYYSINAQSLEGIQIVLDIDKDEHKDVLQSYHNYPVLGVDVDESFAFRSMVMKQALHEKIVTDGNAIFADINPIQGNYSDQFEIEDGSILPFQSPDRLAESRFKEQFSDSATDVINQQDSELNSPSNRVSYE